MDIYIAAARSVRPDDADRLGRCAYAKRLYGTTYTPAVEQELWEITKVLAAGVSAAAPAPSAPAETLAALRAAVYTDVSRRVSARAQRDFREFFNGVWPKWVFNALRLGTLPQPSFLPASLADVEDPTGTDLPFFEKKYKTTLAPAMTALPLKELPPAPALPMRLPSAVQRQRARSLYKGAAASFESDLQTLFNMYLAISESTSNFFSVPPALFMNRGMKAHELFGSPLNTAAPTYSSAFKLEVDLFSSSGSYTDYVPVPGTLVVVNPPFDEDMMEDAVRAAVGDAYMGVAVLLVLPNWSSATFKARQMLEKVAGVGGQVPVSVAVVDDKTACKFYDYWTDSYIAATGVVIGVLGEAGFTAQDVAAEWKNY